MASAGRHSFGSNPQQDRPSAPQPARDANLGGWPAWSPCWLETIIHALITSDRRRRRDLAILKTLGFGRGQVSQTVARPATTLALVAGLMVLPLGIAGGRRPRRLLAEQPGVAAGPVVPPPPVLVIAPIRRRPRGQQRPAALAPTLVDPAARPSPAVPPRQQRG